MALVTAAVIAVGRVDAYTRFERTLQTARALLAPVLGAVVMLVMAKEATAEPPKPEVSRFDRDPHGGGWPPRENLR